MTFSRDDPRTRLTVRIKDDKKEALKNMAENRGINMSDLVREQIDDILGVTKKPKHEVTPPVENDLETGWHILCRLSDKDGNVNADIAKNVISQETGQSMKLVEESVIKPLAQRGYLTVKPRLKDVVYSLRVYYNE